MFLWQDGWVLKSVHCHLHSIQPDRSFCQFCQITLLQVVCPIIVRAKRNVLQLFFKVGQRYGFVCMSLRPSFAFSFVKYLHMFFTHLLLGWFILSLTFLDKLFPGCVSLWVFSSFLLLGFLFDGDFDEKKFLILMYWPLAVLAFKVGGFWSYEPPPSTLKPQRSFSLFSPEMLKSVFHI